MCSHKKELQFTFNATITQIESGIPVFTMTIPDNFTQFDKEQQKHLLAFMQSEIEFTPAYQRTPCKKCANKALNESVSLVLAYDESSGFKLNVDGSQRILNEDIAPICARSLITSLEEIEKAA
jgi:hypothetical protein